MQGVINATGPFTDAIRKLDQGADTQEIVAPSSGVHIVLPGYFSPARMVGKTSFSSNATCIDIPRA
jgi:glycerol-3-phosphate dehydrogenase